MVFKPKDEKIFHPGMPLLEVSVNDSAKVVKSRYSEKRNALQYDVVLRADVWRVTVLPMVNDNRTLVRRNQILVTDVDTMELAERVYGKFLNALEQELQSFFAIQTKLSV